jgi:heme/copper-type cytochrome/quinol oxidase subunit 2
MAATKRKEGVAMQKFVAGLALSAVLLSAAVVYAGETRSFTVVNVEYEGTKIWLPGTLVVHKGDTVKLKLINNVKSGPNQHGFSIPALKVEAVVTLGEPKEIEFVADKAGIFPIICQLHPAHVGGELVVLE